MMAHPIDAHFGTDTYALLSRCAACGKRYDDHDRGWTTTMTTEGSTACWLLFCMGCAEKMAKEDDDD